MCVHAHNAAEDSESFQSSYKSEAVISGGDATASNCKAALPLWLHSEMFKYEILDLLIKQNDVLIQLEYIKIGFPFCEGANQSEI